MSCFLLIVPFDCMDAYVHVGSGNKNSNKRSNTPSDSPEVNSKKSTKKQKSEKEPAEDSFKVDSPGKVFYLCVFVPGF